MNPIDQQTFRDWNSTPEKQRSNGTRTSSSQFGIVSTTGSPVRENEFPDVHVCKAESSDKFNTVLVMDDEVAVREVIAKILMLNKYKVESACEGSEAVDLYKRAKNSDNCYDAVILDLNVPGGMGGGEAMQHLKLIDPDVKGILSSGYSADPMVANFKDYGFSAMLPKPFKMNDLIFIVNQVIT